LSLYKTVYKLYYRTASGGSRQPPASSKKYLKNYGRPLAATTIKKLYGRGMPSLLRTRLSEQAKFCPHQNFAKRKPIFQGAEIGLKKLAYYM